MSQHTTVLPEWIEPPQSEHEKYLELITLIQSSKTTLLFRLHNLSMYALFAFFLYSFVAEVNELVSIALISSASLTFIASIGIIIEFKRQGFALAMLARLYKQLPKRSKLFFGFALVITIYLVLASLYFPIEGPVDITYLAYSSPIPVFLAIYSVLLIYPLYLIRRHMLKHKIRAIKVDQPTQTQEKKLEKIHAAGNTVTYKQVENDPEDLQMGPDPEILALVQHIGSRKSNPLALNSEELEQLEESDAVQIYFDIYGTDSSHV